MSFSFKKEDDFKSLHPNIASYMKVFVEHRFEAYDNLVLLVKEQDFEKIRDLCHGQLGVAGSYKCYKLEEIILYIQSFARKEDIGPIEAVLPILHQYLMDLKSKV